MVQTGCIGDVFLWKRMGLAELGEKGKSRGGKSKSLCSENLHSWQEGGSGRSYID